MDTRKILTGLGIAGLLASGAALGIKELNDHTQEHTYAGIYRGRTSAEGPDTIRITMQRNNGTLDYMYGEDSHVLTEDRAGRFELGQRVNYTFQETKFGGILGYVLNPIFGGKQAIAIEPETVQVPKNTTNGGYNSEPIKAEREDRLDTTKSKGITPDSVIFLNKYSH